MMKTITACLLLFPLFYVLFFTGCAVRNDTRETRYYTLEYPPPEMEDLTSLPHVLRVEPFQVSPEYDTFRMVYRDGDYQRNSYHYHNWRANPGDLVTYFLARDLRHSKLFKAVFSPDNGLKATHVVHGVVEEFLEFDREDHWEAVVSLNISLLKEGETNLERRVAFQKTYSVSETASPQNPSGVAAAMSRAMARISEMTMLDIHEVLKR